MRVRMLQSAHVNFDTDAADELFTQWKTKQGVVAQTLAAEKANRTDAVRAAGVTSAPASEGKQRVKKYRRADIIRLIQKDPKRYTAMADEILLAYATNRVIN